MYVLTSLLIGLFGIGITGIFITVFLNKKIDDSDKIKKKELFETLNFIILVITFFSFILSLSGITITLVKIEKAKSAVQIINQEYNTQFTAENYFFNQKLVERILVEKDIEKRKITINP